MQHLQVIQLRHALETPDGQNEVTAAEWCRTHPVDATDLSRILSACPSLSSLDVRHALQPGDPSDSAWRSLLQLPTSCKSLTVAGSAGRPAAAAVLSRLTQLTRLLWGGSKGVLMRGLLRLTNLIRLRELELGPRLELVSLAGSLFFTEDGVRQQPSWLPGSSSQHIAALTPWLHLMW